MTAKKADEAKSTDDIQNGGQLTVEERLTALEKRVQHIIDVNCLIHQKPE